ncbi:MAG: hypothetical protein NT061_03980 [Spirochaetes bacterium]|nr:hypothetical protein [Spirochaetota bacterium]
MLFKKRKDTKGDAEKAFITAPAALTEPGIPGSLIAAIVAAIAAESGLSPQAFKVASINPSGNNTGFNTPVWGRVERLTRV